MEENCKLSGCKLKKWKQWYEGFIGFYEKNYWSLIGNFFKDELNFLNFYY
jgi:hypothetical protein